MDDINAAELYLDNLGSPKSRRSMTTSLNVVAAYLGYDSYKEVPWHAMTYGQAMTIRSRLIREYKPATANKMLSVMRQTAQFAWKMGQMDSETCQRITSVKRIPYTRDLMGRYIEEDEMQRLFQACIDDKRPNGVRDLAILHIFRYAGLRRNEATLLDVSDFDLEERTIYVRFGKGRQVRTIPIPHKATNAVQAWMDIYDGDANAPLFPSIMKSGEIVVRRMTDQSILYIVHRRAAAAGVTNIRPHDFRRTYISSLFDKNVDISTIMQLAGHDKADQTVQYDRRKGAPKRRAADLFDE